MEVSLRPRISSHSRRSLSAALVMIFLMVPISAPVFGQDDEGEPQQAPSSEEERDVIVRFRDHDGDGPADIDLPDSLDIDLPDHAMDVYINPEVHKNIEDIMRRAREQQRQAEQAMRLKMRHLEGVERQELQEEMRRLHAHTREMHRQMRELPERELEEYFDDLRDNNQALFGQLREEWQLERRSHRLARRWRLEGREEEKEELRRELRDVLQDAWEIKRENRRREIDMLEEKLGELRSEVEESEENRERIIEERMEALLQEDE